MGAGGLYSGWGQSASWAPLPALRFGKEPQKPSQKVSSPHFLGEAWERRRVGTVSFITPREGGQRVLRKPRGYGYNFLLAERQRGRAKEES